MAAQGTQQDTPPTTAPGQEATAAAPTLWILGPWRDLLLFVATPVLILPAILGAKVFFTSALLNKAVMAMGAMGHHLPGMMRAYGDRSLFRRFKLRFILSPVLFVGLCVGFALANLQGMVFVAYAWGVWHGLMQTYGFLRIYDAKVKSFARLTTRLDLGLCAAWFLGGVVFSNTRVDYIQEMASSCGWPVLSPHAIDAVRDVFGVVLAVVSVAFVANVARCRLAGHGQSPIKILLVVTSFGWWWYANVMVEDILIGLILFELFHDVQYLTIVWLFNRKRVDTDPGVGSFSRFLFRRSYGLLAVYVGLVALYGGLGPIAETTFQSDVPRNVARGLVTASALLHFYYDGFIWKVREQSTRKNLGLAGGGDDITVRRWFGLTPAGAHAAKWLFLLLPVGVLGVTQARNRLPEAERARALADVAYDPTTAVARLAVALGDEGDLEGAAEAFDRLRELAPENETYRLRYSRAELAFGEELLAGDRVAEATPHLRAAYEIEPTLPGFLNEEGRALMKDGDLDAAALRYRAAVIMKPEQAQSHLNLALVLEKQGKVRPAYEAALRGLQLLPNDANARAFVARLERALDGN